MSGSGFEPWIWQIDRRHRAIQQEVTLVAILLFFQLKWVFNRLLQNFDQAFFIFQGVHDLKKNFWRKFRKTTKKFIFSRNSNFLAKKSLKRKTASKFSPKFHCDKKIRSWGIWKHLQKHFWRNYEITVLHVFRRNFQSLHSTTSHQIRKINRTRMALNLKVITKN